MKMPKGYDHAELSADARAVLACARFVWDDLTSGEQQLLLAANEAGWLVSGRKRDRDRLLQRGLARGRGTGVRLTPIGAVVREVGYATN